PWLQLSRSLRLHRGTEKTRPKLRRCLSAATRLSWRRFCRNPRGSSGPRPRRRFGHHARRESHWTSHACILSRQRAVRAFLQRWADAWSQPSNRSQTTGERPHPAPEFRQKHFSEPIFAERVKFRSAEDFSWPRTWPEQTRRTRAQQSLRGRAWPFLPRRRHQLGDSRRSPPQTQTRGRIQEPSCTPPLESCQSRCRKGWYA